ncbi:MAG TPA: aminotransferase class I/II-fold pyridoxal phosphate-dependent enzyme [Firmicutes bacterium]|nr:aminotransferase class I/II-fold pyridoxal phosphate-dependent enzyme [Bacillota bacterium]
MEYSERIKSLPPYIFAEIDKKKKAAIQAGRPIINLGIGDPDRPTPKKIVDYAKKALEKPENHPYPIGSGSGVFKESIIKWMYRRFNAAVSMEEVLVLIGAKDGITHLPFAYVNKGDIVLIPDPAYPGYRSATLLAEGEPYFMPLTAENNFLPDLEAVPEEVYKKAKIMFLNYPNNPISATADKGFYEKAVEKAKKYDFLIAQDNAYSEIYFDEENKPLSILEIQGAKDCAIEFYSMSKTYNMTGWRVAFVVGNAKAVKGLLTVKENIDSGTFTALQEVSAFALEKCDEESRAIRELYKKRAQIFYKGLTELGYKVLEPNATLYLWCEVPKSYDSMDFVSKVLDEADMVITPGIGFGKMADKYFRIALTVEEKTIAEALERFKKLKL